MGHQIAPPGKSFRPVAHPIWSFAFQPGEDIQAIVASFGKVLSNRTMLYKYLDPRLFTILTAFPAKAKCLFTYYVVLIIIHRRRNDVAKRDSPLLVTSHLFSTGRPCLSRLFDVARTDSALRVLKGLNHSFDVASKENPDSLLVTSHCFRRGGQVWGSLCHIAALFNLALPCAEVQRFV